MVLKNHCFSLIIDNIRNGDATNTTFFSLCLALLFFEHVFAQKLCQTVVKNAFHSLHSDTKDMVSMVNTSL